jgi:hypothetical protein
LLVVAKIKVSILEVKIVITDGIIYRKVYFINKSERGDIYYGGCINPIVEHISYHLNGNVKHTSEPRYGKDTYNLGTGRMNFQEAVLPRLDDFKGVREFYGGNFTADLSNEYFQLYQKHQKPASNEKLVTIDVSKHREEKVDVGLYFYVVEPNRLDLLEIQRAGNRKAEQTHIFDNVTPWLVVVVEKVLTVRYD